MGKIQTLAILEKNNTMSPTSKKFGSSYHSSQPSELIQDLSTPSFLFLCSLFETALSATL